MIQRARFMIGLGLAACGPQAEPVTTPEPAPIGARAPAPAPAPEGTSGAKAPSAPAPPGSPAPEPKPAAPSIDDVCYAMCDKVKAKCPQSAFDNCRVNCTKYDP